MGRALCVSSARYTEAELQRLTEQVIMEIPQVRGSGANVVANRVEVTVFVATEEFQRELDARYGPGAVWAGPGVARPVA